MSDSQRITKVNVDAEIKFGEFANAFRVVEEVGPDCFLDFMVYSADARAATVVSRVRVRREFLERIRKTLGEAIYEFSEGSDFSVQEPLVMRKNGKMVH